MNIGIRKKFLEKECFSMFLGIIIGQRNYFMYLCNEYSASNFNPNNQHQTHNNNEKNSFSDCLHN